MEDVYKRQMYIHCGQTLYRCSEEGSEALEGYLAALQAGQGSLFKIGRAHV